MDKELYPRTLIIGTLPYHPNESSRALDTYFGGWPKEKLRMFFSNANAPIKGHCSSLYQTTDKELIKKFFKRKMKAGRIYNYDDLEESSSLKKATEDGNGLFKSLSKPSPLRFYLRKKLWKQKRWLSEELLNWVKEFNPEAIYICYSNDYFILDIGLYFANLYNIPIICQISDDYYFCDNPASLKSYMKKYKKLFNDVMNTDGFAIYIADKIANKYNETFKKQGFPIYLGSNFKTPENLEIKYEFNYFGKINLDRYSALAKLGSALKEINPDYVLNIYTDEFEGKKADILTKAGCQVNKPIPYSKVSELMTSGSFNIVASGFNEKEVNKSKYSLSTKVADCLVSGSPIIAVGSKEDGAIEYLSNNKAAIILNDENNMVDVLKEYLTSKDKLNEIVESAQETYKRNHLLEINRNKFQEECSKYRK